jgi:hypothetical protein
LTALTVCSVTQCVIPKDDRQSWSSSPHSGALRLFDTTAGCCNDATASCAVSRSLGDACPSKRSPLNQPGRCHQLPFPSRRSGHGPPPLCCTANTTDASRARQPQGVKSTQSPLQPSLSLQTP